MAEKAEKVGFMAGTARFFKDVKSELKKVVWPTYKQTVHNTNIVILFMALVAVFLFVIDSVFMVLIKGIIQDYDFMSVLKEIFNFSAR